MSREKAIRKAFTDAIRGAVNVPGQTVNKVPFSDGQDTSGANLYILVESQSANRNENFTRRSWNGTIVLSICHKQGSSYTRDIIDDVCNDIENIVCPGKTPETGLVQQPGWNISNVYAGDISYTDFQISDTKSICIKFITFNFIITKI